MTQKNNYPYYVQTLPGAEEIAWLEIRKRLPDAVFREYLFAKDQNGIVTFDYSGPAEPLLELRTIEDIFFQAINIRRVERSFTDLKFFSKLVEESESFGRAANAFLRVQKFSQPPTFRIISRKYGQHQYRRKDFELAVLRGVQARYPRWTAVADQSQVEIWANLLGSHLLIGFRLSDRTMRHRFKKKVELPASLRPSLAAAMVFLTQPEPNDVFLDPMCGSGTIILERLAAGSYQKIFAGDILPDRVEAAQKNIPPRRKGGQRPNLSIRQWDARSLPLEDGSVDKVATNLPFGKQIGPGENLEKLYTTFFGELVRVVRPNGRIILLSSQYDLIKSCLRQHPQLSINTGYSVATLGRWGRIYIVDRLP